MLKIDYYTRFIPCIYVNSKKLYRSIFRMNQKKLSLHDKAKLNVRKIFEPAESCSSRYEENYNKWLEKQLGKDSGTISKWCTNTCQPNIGSLMDFAELLEEEVTELLRLNKYGINI